MTFKSKFLRVIAEQSPKGPETVDEMPPESGDDPFGASGPQPDADQSSPELTSEGEAYLVGLIKKALLLDLDEESKKQVLHVGNETGHITPENAKKILDELVHLMDIEDGGAEVANMLDQL